MRLTALFVVLFAVFALFATAVAPPARAQATASVAAKTEPGLWSRAVAHVAEKQRQFHRELTGALKDLRDRRSAQAAWTLIAVSFLYGLFHAAGPGHGKFVLTTYLLTHENKVARGIGLSAAAAFVQGLTALAIVFGLVGILGWLPRQTESAVTWVERFSFALVAAMGAYLAFRALMGLMRAFGARIAPAHGCGHDHGSHGQHVHGPDCGHVHAPAPDAGKGWPETLGIVLSIGIRPCSGAILVLAFANVFGLPWAGAGAVLAMSAGTAIAVATLALIAVNARKLAASLVDVDAPLLRIGMNGLALGGGGLILALGIVLLVGSFGAAHPLGLGR